MPGKPALRDHQLPARHRAANRQPLYVDHRAAPTWQVDLPRRLIGAEHRPAGGGESKTGRAGDELQFDIRQLRGGQRIGEADGGARAINRPIKRHHHRAIAPMGTAPGKLECAISPADASAREGEQRGGDAQIAEPHHAIRPDSDAAGHHRQAARQRAQKFIIEPPHGSAGRAVDHQCAAACTAARTATGGDIGEQINPAKPRDFKPRQRAIKTDRCRAAARIGAQNNAAIQPGAAHGDTV